MSAPRLALEPVIGRGVFCGGQSKMVGMNLSLALEVARYRITGSSVAPSWIATGAITPDMNAAKNVPIGIT